MIAKIKAGKLIYDSFVFALEYKGHDSKVVVLDESYKNLIVVDYWNNMDRNVLFTDMNCDGYYYNNDIFKSYWPDKNIIKNIEKRKYKEEMLNEALKLQQSIKKDEWIKVKCNSDLDALIDASGYFHDAYIVKVNKTNEYTEILFNTTWNAYIQLRCYDVFLNELVEDDCFNHCDYEFNEDNVILRFDSFNYDKEIILKAKEIEFKVYHEYKRKFTDYKISDKEITFYYKDNINEVVKINELVSNSIFEKETIGIIDFPFGIKLNFFYENYILCMECVKYKDEDLNYEYAKEIEEDFKKNNLNLYIDSDWECEDYNFKFDYGNAIYEEKYSKIRNFIYFSKFATIPLLINILFWLILKLLSPQMMWIAFYIFGLGISLFSYLICLIVYFKEYHFIIPTITIYESGITQKGNYNPFWLSYEDIEYVVYGKRIIIHTKNRKFKLIKSKNNKYIYSLIKEKIDSIKEA